MPDPQPPTPTRHRGLAAVADQAWLLMILPGLFWSSNAIISRAVAGFLPPVGVAFWRWLLASFLILPLAWPHLRRDAGTMLRAWPMVLLLSILGGPAFNAVSYYAAHTTAAVNMVMLQTVMPVLVVPASFLLFGERVTARQAAGIGICLLGALTLVAEGDFRLLTHLEIRQGDFLILLVASAYAVYTALLRRAPRVHGFSLLYAVVLVGSLLLLPAYIAESHFVMPMPFTWRAAGVVLYSAVLPTVVAYLAYNRAVALLGPNVAGLANYTVPVFGTILAAILLRELPHLYHFAGIALIVAGIVLASRRAAPRSAPAAAGEAAPVAAPERPVA